MGKRHPIKISGGSVEFLHDDQLYGHLAKHGAATAKRASHVEPSTINGEVRWTADMSPSNGSILDNDGKGYKTRKEALDAEVAWLKENRFKI